MPASTNPLQHFQEQINISEVQAGGGFVEQIERFAGAGFDEFAGEFHALRLAAGKRGRRLPEFHVVESHVVQSLQFMGDMRDVFKMSQCILDVHFQHVGDGFSLEFYLQCLAVESVAFANGTCDPNIGQEIHFQLGRAVAFAGLAASAFDIEAETTGFIAACLRFGTIGCRACEFRRRP